LNVQNFTMKKLLLFIALIPVIGFSQPFDFSAKIFDFQSVYYPNMDSLKLTLNNTSGFDIGVVGIDVFSIYGKKPFFVKDSVFTMTVGNAHDVWIYFEPEQNILHEMYAVVKTDFRGDYLVALTGKGKYIDTYYNATYNKVEQDLKSAMKSITSSGHVDLGYSGARDKMFMNIDNQKVNGQGASQNTIEGVYTGQLIVGYTSRTDAQNQGFNTEHTFPQGFFNSNLPMRSDLHHLFPTNAAANSQRSNLQFGVVTSPTWSVGGSKKGNGKFEPRDAQKGQVARALFYFVVRYQDYSNHVLGQESILRQWFAQYPPNAVDIKRNEDIYTYQKNRNPFVDYPQFLKRITKISGNSVPSTNPSLYVSRDTVDMRFQKDSLVYTISLINTGYGMLNLTDFTISDTTHFRLMSPTQNVFFPPGEGFEIEIRVVPGSFKTVTEHLTFNTGMPNNPTMDIVLEGEWGSVSVKENELVVEPKVYPNPANESVIISWDNQGAYDLKIYSMLGSLVYFEEVKSTNKNVDVSSFPAGIYVLETVSGNVTSQTYLVIK